MPRLTRLRLLAGLALVLVIGVVLALASRRPAPAPGPEATASAGPAERTPGTPTATLTSSATPTPSRTPTPSATPTAAGGGGLVAFVLDGELRLADVLSGVTARLTFDPEREGDPDFAPDGRSLAFSARRDANWDLYRLELNDGRLTRLTEHAAYDGRPAWSPDGGSLAFETLRAGDLDIYMLPLGGEARPLVNSPAAESAPAWSPDGRWLVYSAHTGGQRDLYLIPAEGGETVNLTQSDEQHEDEPAVSPDGRLLAYSAGLGGERALYVAPIDLAAGRLITTAARLVARGAAPVWSPDAGSLAYHVPSRRTPRVELRAAHQGLTWALRTFQADLLAGPVAWTAGGLPELAWSRERAAAPTPAATALYVEEIGPRPAEPPFYRFVRMPVYTSGPFLSERVDDSFTALRERVIAETGLDYLTIFGDMWRGIEANARPGQSTRSWHKAGRAFDMNQGPYGAGQAVVVVHEQLGDRVFWRVYVRAGRQDGTQGEPLRVAPWDFSVRPESEDAPPTGGEPRQQIPSGYWLDFTRLAGEYGWRSVGALRRWRTYYPDTDWWHFQKTDGLSWVEAMREVYLEEEIEAVFGSQ
jgi:TolB protein